MDSLKVQFCYSVLDRFRPDFYKLKPSTKITGLGAAARNATERFLSPQPRRCFAFLLHNECESEGKLSLPVTLHARKSIEVRKTDRCERGVQFYPCASEHARHLRGRKAATAAAAAASSAVLPLLDGSSQCTVLQTARGVTWRARLHREGGEQRDATCVKPNTPTQIAILHRVKNMVRKLLLSDVSRSRSSRSCGADL